MLAGVRPEEIGEWREGPVEPATALSFAASSDAQAQAVEQAIEQGRRVAARGGDAVVLIDTLDALPAGRRAAGAGRGAQHRRRRLADRRRHRRGAGRAARRRSSRSTPRWSRSAATRRSTSRPRACCARSCWSARRAPRRSPRPARSSSRAERPSGRTVAVRPGPSGAFDAPRALSSQARPSSCTNSTHRGPARNSTPQPAWPAFVSSARHHATVAAVMPRAAVRRSAFGGAFQRTTHVAVDTSPPQPASASSTTRRRMPRLRGTARPRSR